MKERLSQRQIADIMSLQCQVWNNTPHGPEVLEDCCHAFAEALGLDDDKRTQFLTRCLLKKCELKGE